MKVSNVEIWLSGISIIILAVFATSKLNPYWVEGIIGIFSLISMGTIFFLRSPEPVVKMVPVSDFPPITLPQVKPSNEQLDISKYM